ncbi:uncharacterized protein LOC128928797 [Callithrix jacchus]
MGQLVKKTKTKPRSSPNRQVITKAPRKRPDRRTALGPNITQPQVWEAGGRVRWAPNGGDQQGGGEVLEKQQQAFVTERRPPGQAGRLVSRELRPELEGLAANPSQGQKEPAWGSSAGKPGPAAGRSQTAPVQLPPGRGQSQARPRPSSSREAAGRAGRTRQAAQEKPRLVPPLPPRGPGDREARGSSERRQPAHVPSPARGSSGPAAQRPVRCCRRRQRAGEAQSIAIREGEGRRVELEPGSEAAEGSRARWRRSKSAPQAANPPTATWGAAETADRGAGAPTRDAESPPLPRRCSPRRLGLDRTFLPRLFCGAPWRPSRFPVSSSALVHARPARSAPWLTLRALLRRAPCRTAKLRPNLSRRSLLPRPPALRHELPTSRAEVRSVREAPPPAPGRPTAPRFTSKKILQSNPGKEVLPRTVNVVQMRH